MALTFTTLNRNADFHRTYRRGKVYTSPALVSYVTKNRAGICRIGITTSKKIGNAVERNRSRRVIRAAFRAVEPQLNPGWDIVFVARSKTKYLKSTQLEAIMRKHLEQAGVMSQ